MKTRIFMCLVLILTILIFPNLCILGATDGINTCLYTVIPSLFPFFVVSKMFISCGGASFFGKFLNSFMNKFFNVSGNGATPFVLGIISGYPVGAKAVCDLYKRGDLKKCEAQNLIGFCNNSGPCFLIGAIGVTMLGSSYFGYVLYLIHILASISVGITIRKNKNYNLKSLNIAKNDISTTLKNTKKDIFTSSVEDSVSTMLSVCGYIIFFSVIIKILSKITDNPLLSGLFEMTTAVKNLCLNDNFPFESKIVIISFLCGFAGLSVNMQTKKIISETDLSFSKYIYAKLLHAIYSAIYSILYIKIFAHTIPVFALHQKSNLYSPNTNIFLSISIIIFALYLLKKQRFMKN